MKKKILVFGVVIAIALTIAVFASNESVQTNEPEPQPEQKQNKTSELKTEPETHFTEADIVMPNKVSRPGCEEDNRCYVPTTFSAAKGQTVIWSNEDVAFHSVTSGFYGSPSGLFDSGHLDPYESFSYTFEETGTYDYYCTLHPWMAGQIIVE
ncbi:plastocyanin/azurin family copper-binding protein [Nitrosopumilus sp. K4]|uniref:cupredoxin domain-containing protein n=1 Tax=Nitrosopumilus sp. K4 TaxID=2795383 RepID=UPI002012085C|nr:plastocyanin/azurin family copper-binding protein [Nitrosopumilus sp. K4]